MLNVFLGAIWFILPAYVANASAVIIHDRHPLDQGLKFLDGKPLLGRGKTFGGFLSGVCFGTLASVVQAGSVMLVGGTFSEGTILLGFFLAFGAMTGDSVGSFFKRRFDLKRGQATPLLDQWDFIFGALLFSFLLLYFVPVVAFPDFLSVLVILVLTPVLHIISNFIAHRLGFKAVPW